MCICVGGGGGICVSLGPFSSRVVPSLFSFSLSPDHVDHIRNVAGIDHVGIGSDFDGIEL